MKRLIAVLFCAGIAAAQSVGPTVTPTSLTFSYQVNSSTLPSPAKLTATLPAATSTLPIAVTVTSLPAGWLTVTPDTGHSPLAMTVTVNPTSLTPGSYTGKITIDSVPTSNNPASVTVTLSISNPPSRIQVTSPTASATSSGDLALTFTYTTGAANPSPTSAEVDVASNGDIIPFNVTAANAASKGKTATWLRVNASGQLASLQTSGVALSGSCVPIYVTLDLPTVMTLDPGSYAGVVTVGASNAVNGSATVSVNLIISAGPPTLNAALPIFPSTVIAGPSIDQLITIYGDNFFATSVVTLQQGTNPAITLPSTLLSRKVLQATIKAAYLAPPASGVYPVNFTLAVTNPAPPNNPSQGAATTAFSVTSPTAPAITSIVNSASFLPAATQTGTGANPAPTGAAISPRELISIFGQNLGPTTVTPTTPSGSPLAYPTTADTIQVLFTYGATPTVVLAPIIVTSSNQINCIVPTELTTVIGTASPYADVQVRNGAVTTAKFTVTVIPEDPGVFTFGGLGQGQGAILNIDGTTGAYVINSTKASSPRGSTISIYATGLGDLKNPPAVANGEVALSAITVADSTVRVDIDGQPAVVTYAGTSPGAVAGLVQINAIVPPTVRTGTAIPLTVSIGSAAASRRSQSGVTIAIK